MSGRPVLVTSLRGRQEEGHHSQPQAPSLQPPRLANDLGSSSTSPDGGTASSLSRGCTRACIPCLSDLAVWLRRHGWFSSLSGGEIGTPNKTTIPTIGIYCINLRPFRRTSVMAGPDPAPIGALCARRTLGVGVRQEGPWPFWCWTWMVSSCSVILREAGGTNTCRATWASPQRRCRIASSERTGGISPLARPT